MVIEKKNYPDEKFKDIPNNFKFRAKKKFYTDFGHLNDSEVLKEILYFQKEQAERVESIRQKLNLIVLFFIIIPLLLAITYYALTINASV